MTETAVFLDTPLPRVIGDRTAKALTKAFGFDTVGGLLGHYPRRYAERGELTALDSLPLDESVTIVAEVVRVNNRPMNGRKGSLLEIVISDGTGTLSLTFFNQAWRANALHRGVRGIFAGKVGEFRGQRQLTHPDYELFDEDENVSDEVAELWAKTPIPIYPATSTVASWQIAKALGVEGGRQGFDHFVGNRMLALAGGQRAVARRAFPFVAVGAVKKTLAACRVACGHTGRLGLGLVGI